MHFQILMCICVSVFSFLSAEEDDLLQAFTEHRLKLLENGFEAFTEEVLPRIDKVQEKLRFVTETNKQLARQLQDVTIRADHLSDALEEQETLISDVLWALGDIKGGLVDDDSEDILAEIEWTLFDVQQSNTLLLEEMCRKQTECGDWSEWGSCSASCGTGSSSRSRVCTNGGKFKSYCKPITSDTRGCTGINCILPDFNELDCPENYVSYQGYCLRFSESRSSRLLSTIRCEIDDAHLVEIDSPGKQAVIAQFIKSVASDISWLTDDDIHIRMNSNYNDVEDPWLIAIDGVRHANEKAYLNWKGREMTYFQWAIGQPRNDQSDGAYCITFSVKNNRWYLKCCSKLFYYICEAPAGGI